MGELLAEFRRLRRISRWEEFLAGLNGRSYYDRWRGDDAPEQFEAQLDRIEVLLATAENGGWVHLSL